MLRKLLPALVLAVLPGLRALAQDVPYEKYTLPNGLTVILHEDHSLPVACVNVWYRVGAKDEAPGRSGFAHLFEHLMFMGTNRVPGSDFDNLMEAGGGFNNASTSEDRTNYFSMGPAELLPTLLWLEADRLEDLGKAMTQEKLDKQRDVVRNERRQTTENVPYGKAENEIVRLMYPRSHPYWGTVIGSHEDLEAGTLDDVKNFFATYYVPSNASLVVAGDFDKTATKELINRLFASLPRGGDVLHAEARPVTLEGVKRITYTDDVQFPRTYVIYHSPANFAPGDAEMDLAAGVLASGISSRLYQKLIYEGKLCTEVDAAQMSMLLGSLFIIQATAAADVSLDAVEKAIDETVGEFLAKGPTADELDRQKAQIEFATVSGLQSILNKADSLNEYEYFFGEPNSFRRDLDRYRAATPADVQQWATKVLTPGARVFMRVIPEIETPEANPRDAAPQLASERPFAPLIPETFKLAGGITVHHWERKELPLVAMTLLAPYGAACDPAAKAGLSMLTADMLDEGAGERTAVQFSDALDAIGATFGAGASLESTTVSLSVLSSRFDPALALFADAVMRPRFDKVEWDRVHNLHLQDLAAAQDHPATVANWVAMRAFFGDAHPYSRPLEGTPTTAGAISLDDAKAWHQQAYRPSTATLLVAGDVTRKALQEKLEKAFGAWKEPAGIAPPVQPTLPQPATQSMKVVLVDRPGAVQTVVRFTTPGPAYGDPNRPKLELLSTILGGSFTSRLNQNLREDKGYTYGARCGYVMNPAAGYFTAASSVRADVTGASVGEFLKEFAGIRGGNVSAGEAAKARATNRMDMVQDFGGLTGIVAAGARLVRNGRPFTDLADELQAIGKATETELNTLAYNAVPLEKGLLVLVGDRATVLAQLKDLELPAPIELSPLGDPVAGK